ncbi:MAG: protein-methionine-sulfoxide reductase catalytic subunit MsrP [Pirellulales bacterium]|nr:protein-methionine-sulfoxide reductase catalytic subunit MsrP [Pirellulales bacterium]
MDSTRPIPGSQITSERLYFNRRDLLRAGAIAATATATGFGYRWLNSPGGMALELPPLPGYTPRAATPADLASGFRTTEPANTLMHITNYNNYYEFTTNKEMVSSKSMNFRARPWTLRVDGLVHKPRTFDLDELYKLFPPVERVYRMRCVEGWSMVIPWNGFPLQQLLNLVEPTSAAMYVAFETLLDPARFPGQRTMVLPWPYMEGLRLDEAMHPLTLIATGIYGKELPAPNGAPLRLVVPWKYGFKGIKAISRITLTEMQPKTTWNEAAMQEYGFLANVNPAVDHPRWSQATEQRLGEAGRRPTLPFNGYADQVADLYRGVDLRRYF